jgi:hypothetical protein
MKHALAALVVSTLSASVLPALAQSTATIEQQGSLGAATISQEPGLYPFQASIYQGTGSMNGASIRQSGDDAQSFIKQYGDRNGAKIVQGTDGGLAKIWQSGADNQAVIDQLGHALHADVQQSGSGNLARVVERAGFNDVYVTQQGNGNVLKSSPGQFQTVIAEQRGNDNHADLNADTRLVQNGTANTALTRGTGSAAIDQYGVGNLADVDIGGIDSKVTIEQHGNANRAGVVSQGDGNLATIRQGGQANVALIGQNRSGVTATIVQNTVGGGYGNLATIVQR